MAEKSIEKIYQKKTQLEHILLRQDTYVGSVEAQSQDMWVLDRKNGKFINKNINYVPGLYKIFDEILVNAIDNYQRDRRGMTQIKVNIDQKNSLITVYNNGKSIPIEMHKEHKVYVPELVFGHLLTSSNYDDTEKKVSGGRNGFGAKLTNIFSKKFTIEIVDSKKKKKYIQEFSNNMSKIESPNITAYDGDIDYTQIIFEPDLKKFGLKSLDDDMASLMAKRVYDTAGISPKTVKVYFDEKKVAVDDFQQYVSLYFQGNQSELIHEKCGERWEICVTQSPSDQFQQVSFVNGICTINGGTHVMHVSEQICDSLIDVIKKKHKKIEVKPYQVKQQMWVFINCLIENPAFDSQTKETLTSRQNLFGSKCEISASTLKKIQNCGMVQTIVENFEMKESIKLKRQLGTGGQKKQKLYGIPKLEDAFDAGTQNSLQCTLILTEGDSAKSLAMSGLQITGMDRFGVFPLRGKLLNVRDCQNSVILNNEEIQNLIKIMGFFVGKEYDDLRSLRYGSIMIMADQDHDGSHIKGLIINFIHHFWPSLIKKNPGFLKEFVTPIIKATKEQEVISFFTIAEYERWASQRDIKGYKIKYYKGLGTSTSAEGKEYFKNLEKHRIKFKYSGQLDDEKIELAFSKKMANQRKDWLAKYNQRNHIDHSVKEIKYSDFIDKELIHFSIADNIRSIPSVVDGLKPGQRKILFACIKKKLKNEIKVAQLSGYVAEKSAYHHGEVSLQQTIVNMAQDFVGSNNLNLLMPNGQFGTRAQGGKEAASARYIFTNLNPLTRILFNEKDEPLLNFQIEEGQSIEPEIYFPIIPMCLVNGATGIGTGWSTFVPCYSPLDIISNIKRKLKGQYFLRMVPWYKGFKGEINKNDDQLTSFTVKGNFNRISHNKFEITELPIQKWTRDFKNSLEVMAQNNEITDIKEYHKDNAIKFVVKLPEEELRKLTDDDIIKKFKLSANISCNNLVLFNPQFNIKRYNNECEVLEEFYHVRYKYYKMRKASLLKKMNQDYDKFNNQHRFISEIISEELKIFRKPRDEVLELLKLKGFKSFEQIYHDEQSQSKEILLIQNDEGDNGSDLNDDDEEGADVKKKVTKTPFDYLLKLNIFAFTFERLYKLKSQMDEKLLEINQLQESTVEQLWIQDLDEFEKLYKQLCLSREDLEYYNNRRPQTVEYMGVQRNVKEEEKMLDEGLNQTEYIIDAVEPIAEHRQVKKQHEQAQTYDLKGQANRLTTNTTPRVKDQEQEKLIQSSSKKNQVSKNGKAQDSEKASANFKEKKETLQAKEQQTHGRRRKSQAQERTNRKESESSSDESGFSSSQEVIPIRTSSTRRTTAKDQIAEEHNKAVQDQTKSKTTPPKNSLGQQKKEQSSQKKQLNLNTKSGDKTKKLKQNTLKKRRLSSDDDDEDEYEDSDSDYQAKVPQKAKVNKNDNEPSSKQKSQLPEDTKQFKTTRPNDKTPIKTSIVEGQGKDKAQESQVKNEDVGQNSKKKRALKAIEKQDVKDQRQQSRQSSAKTTPSKLKQNSQITSKAPPSKALTNYQKNKAQNGQSGQSKLDAFVKKEPLELSSSVQEEGKAKTDNNNILQEALDLANLSLSERLKTKKEFDIQAEKQQANINETKESDPTKRIKTQVQEADHEESDEIPLRRRKNNKSCMIKDE